MASALWRKAWPSSRKRVRLAGEKLLGDATQRSRKARNADHTCSRTPRSPGACVSAAAKASASSWIAQGMGAFTASIHATFLCVAEEVMRLGPESSAAIR